MTYFICWHARNRKLRPKCQRLLDWRNRRSLSVSLQLTGSCVPSHVVPWTCWRTSESRGMSTGRLWIVLTHQLRKPGCDRYGVESTWKRLDGGRQFNTQYYCYWVMELWNKQLSGKNKHPAWFSWASFLFVLLQKGKIGIISTLQWLVILSEHKLHHL